MVVFVGMLASVAVIGLAFAIQRRRIVVLSSVVSILTGTQYALLHDWATVFLIGIALIYGILCYCFQASSFLQSRFAVFLLIAIYICSFIVANGLVWGIGVLALVAMISGAVVMSISNPLVAKWVLLVNGLTWASFQVATGAYGQLPGELFYFVATVFSLTMLYRAKSQGTPLSQVPEISTIIKQRLLSKRQ